MPIELGKVAQKRNFVVKIVEANLPFEDNVVSSKQPILQGFVIPIFLKNLFFNGGCLAV